MLRCYVHEWGQGYTYKLYWDDGTYHDTITSSEQCRSEMAYAIKAGKVMFCLVCKHTPLWLERANGGRYCE